MRLSGRSVILVAAVAGIILLTATERIVPADSEYLRQMRLWLAARAAGLTAYLLLTLVVTLGLVLSHPVNQSTWRLSKRLFPWHENLTIFLAAFIAAHVVGIVLDPYADVGLVGTFIPGLSRYRNVPVALGSLALYALVLSAVTARYTKLLPQGWWLKIHRLSLLIFAASWAHGVLAGTDVNGFLPVYAATGALVVAAGAYRYWVARRQRPTFSTSLPGSDGAPAVPVPEAAVPKPKRMEVRP